MRWKSCEKPDFVGGMQVVSVSLCEPSSRVIVLARNTVIKRKTMSEDLISLKTDERRGERRRGRKVDRSESEMKKGKMTLYNSVKRCKR